MWNLFHGLHQMQGSLWPHCTGRACCQSCLLKKTQIDSEAYLREMQEDSDNKATPQPQIDQKLQAVIQIYWQGCIVFSLFRSTNIRWCVWCWQHRGFRRGFKNTRKHVPRRYWCLEHSRVSSEELHNALLSHDPNVRTAFSDQQGWAFWRWFDMSTFWDNKGQQFGEKIPLFRHKAQCKGPSTSCFLHQHLLRQQKKRAGFLHWVMHTRGQVTYWREKVDTSGNTYVEKGQTRGQELC